MKKFFFVALDKDDLDVANFLVDKGLRYLNLMGEISLYSPEKIIELVDKWKILKEYRSKNKYILKWEHYTSEK